MASFSLSVFEKSYKPEDDTNKVRTAGLELETVVTNQDCPLYRQNIYDREREINDEVDDYEDEVSEDYVARDIFEEQFIGRNPLGAYFGGVGIDGNDLEFVTHPDSITYFKEGGSQRFKTAMKYLKENCTITKENAQNSGTHVHIGFLPNDDRDYIMDNAYWICMNFATQLQKIAGRVSHWAKFLPYSNMELQRVDISEEMGPGNTYVNMEPKLKTVGTKVGGYDKEIFLVKKHETVEFRLFKATVNIKEALAWVELCHNIVELSNGGKEIEKVTFQDLIKGKYIGDYVKGLTGRRKLDILERKATVQNTLQFKAFETTSTIIL